MAKRNLGVSDEEMASRYSMDSGHRIDPVCLAGRCGNPPTGREEKQGAVKNFVVGVSAIARAVLPQRQIGLQEVVNPEEFATWGSIAEQRVRGKMQVATDKVESITGLRVASASSDMFKGHLDVTFSTNHGESQQAFEQKLGTRCEILSRNRIRIY